jgi:hypothetical protein
MTASSASAFIFATMRAGRPALAFSASRRIRPTMRESMSNGATSIFSIFAGFERDVRKLKTRATSDVSTSRAVSRPRSV